MTLASEATEADLSTIFAPDHYATHGYPHAAWTRLRREEPVYWAEQADTESFWAITRHEDIQAIERDARTFINSKGVTIGKAGDFKTTAAVGIPMMLMMDAPEHNKYRGVVRRRFTAHAMAELDAHIVAKCRTIADDVVRTRIAAAAEHRNFDYVTSIAARLPLDVILELLGVPTDDRDQMFIWSNQIIGSSDPEYGDQAAPEQVLSKARIEIFGYFSQHVASRRVAPKDDLVSLLVGARIDGEPMRDLDILGFCFLLMIAGNETTRNAASGALLALMENPEEMHALRTDAALMPTAIEELLRWVSPIIYMSRTVTSDITVHGKKMACGDKVVLFYPSANRDEGVFTNPFRLDLTRTPNNHLTFGFGRHHCLGNELARIELRAVITETLRTFPDIRLAGPISRLRSNFVGGIKRMPVAVGA